MSRLALLLCGLVAAVLCLSSVSAQVLQCAPVTITAFEVSANSPGQEGSTQLGSVTGNLNGLGFAPSYFTVLLASNYSQPTVFFNVKLVPNDTSPLNSTIIFTIALNSVYKLNSAGQPQEYVNPIDGATNDIEFTNWGFAQRGFTNNTLQLNVQELAQYGLDNQTCSYVYIVTFENPGGLPETGANIVGDPQFRGLRGQSFQVHGVDGAVYNLISDPSMQLNTRFAFLEGPRPCAIMPSTGKQSTACWSHPGSYLSELALKTVGGSQLLIVAGPAASGFSSVSLDGALLQAGAASALDFGTGSELTGSVSVLNSHELSIHAGHFDLVVENNDGFVNLRSVSVPASSWSKLASHGLLGQTWQSRRYSGRIREIEGDVDDYLIEDDNLFGDSFIYNKFTQ